MPSADELKLRRATNADNCAMCSNWSPVDSTCAVLAQVTAPEQVCNAFFKLEEDQAQAAAPSLDELIYGGPTGG